MRTLACRRVTLVGLIWTTVVLWGTSSLVAQSPTLLRLRNAASVDRLVVDSAGGLLALGASGHGALPYSGTGVRMMWYPKKAAFRAGSAGAEWDDAAIGLYSYAANENTIASGVASAAFGSGAQATGGYSFAAGQGAIASGIRSVALGFGVTASGEHAVALGGLNTAAGGGTVALGLGANAIHDGNFIFADESTAATISSVSNNQFSVRASGGYRFFSNATLTSGVTLAAGGSAWNVVSDRRRKEGFLAIDGEDVLARIRTLPLSTWRYIAEADRSTRHLGPMAQDWHAAFGFSRDSLTINTGDIDGVNLAGVQALEARTRAQAERIAALEAENRALRVEQGEVRRRLKRLEATAGK